MSVLFLVLTFSFSAKSDVDSLQFTWPRERFYEVTSFSESLSSFQEMKKICMVQIEDFKVPTACYRLNEALEKAHPDHAANQKILDKRCKIGAEKLSRRFLERLFERASGLSFRCKEHLRLELERARYIDSDEGVFSEAVLK